MDPRLMANALLPRQSDQLIDNWYQQNKLMEQTPPWQQNQGILSNPAPRPQDWHNRSGVTDYVANAINPTMIGYGAGQMAGEARNALLEGHYGEAGGLGILAAMGVMPGARARPARSLDNLGYYSGALEAAKGLKQAKGTPEQMLAMLQKSGAKAGEIEATGLGKFLEGRPSVTRDEIVQHLEGNRIGLHEQSYHSSVEESPAYEAAYDAEFAAGMKEARSYLEDMPDGTVKVDEIIAGPSNRGYTIMERADAEDALRSFVSDGIGNRELQIDNPAKWQEFSLDPSNPTYRETVLHLPESNAPTFEKYLKSRQDKGTAYADPEPEMLARYRAEYDAGAWRNTGNYSNIGGSQDTTFRSGHFPEPNIVGHMMTSMAKHEGKPVYLIDQIQSDWGQRLRDRGVRDEAKIAGIERQLAELEPRRNELLSRIYSDTSKFKDWGDSENGMALWARAQGTMADEQLMADVRRLRSELETAKASSSGHPLVNTTDQWTNTTLRRALRQAADSDAQGLAIPHGDTVLSYNPGDDGGMRGFYGSRVQEGIVPKNLRKLLSSADPAYPGSSRIETLETSAGPRGWNALESNQFDQSQTGFTYFPLTDSARAKIKEGLPLFSTAGLGILGAPAGMNALYGGDNR